jgi:hypothetical protein
MTGSKGVNTSGQPYISERARGILNGPSQTGFRPVNKYSQTAELIQSDEQILLQNISKFFFKVHE